MNKPVVLVVLDGWGISTNKQGNVIDEANLPTIEKLNSFYPMTTLQSSGISVGLFWGEPGNSEVGHMALGAGKIIYQNLPRITLSVQDGSFYSNEAILGSMENVKAKGSKLHLMGLVGDGSVHSYVEHLYALLDMAKKNGVSEVYIHAFTDGRDSAPTSGTQTIKKIKQHLAGLGIGKIATLCGRNWAMDRNNNWDRVEKAYRMLTEAKGEQVSDPIQYMQDSYSKEVTDEYLEPAVITENGKPVATISEGDSIIFFNFREDRARQLTKVFVMKDFKDFEKKQVDVNFVTLTEYEKDLPVNVAFPPEKVKSGLGEILSHKKKKQLRITETEKYAHVTYFFNGGKEDPWEGEDRVLIPSPTVPKFDQSPEMSSQKVTDGLIKSMGETNYDFILVNYANADMVGHTGNEKASIQAVQAVDKSLSRLIPAVLKKGGCLLITADHGNVEEIKNFTTGQIDTEHSLNPVPLWYITPQNHKEKTEQEKIAQTEEVGGLLSDVAPTILDIMEIEKPEVMEGESLLPILK